MERQMLLPDGWYPHDSGACEAEIKSYEESIEKKESRALGAIAPHAGWFFCGRLICQSVWVLKKDVSLVVVFGGHTHPGKEVKVFDYTAFQTPFGALANDHETLKQVKDRFSCTQQAPYEPDNTSEVVLPFVKYYYPEAKVLVLRSPAGKTAIELGSFMAESASDKAVFIGSTDLTHYGPNYGFMPAGTGEEAKDWARKNDRGVIDHLKNLELQKALDHANSKRSACSIGAAVSCASAAKSKGQTKGVELSYTTSAEIAPSMGAGSFVGYVSMVFE